MAIALTQEELMLGPRREFVKDELIPLENKVLARDANGEGLSFTKEGRTAWIHGRRARLVGARCARSSVDRSPVTP
jgi:hypothetical protein